MTGVTVEQKDVASQEGWSAWTPNQRRVIERILGRDHALRQVIELPRFPDDLGRELGRVLEREVADVAAPHTPTRPLVITKHHLSALFQCEGFLQAEQPFSWDIPKIRGTAAARAVSLLHLNRFKEMPALTLAEYVVEAMAAGGDGLADYLSACSEVERGEITLACADDTAKFQADWPPLDRAWGLRPETPSVVSVLAGRVQLRAKYDLAIGHPGSNPSDVVLVDFKSGKEYADHIEEVRHYALLETMRTGVPPRLVAVYYLAGGRFREEVVTEDSLMTALRRAVDGVRRIEQLWSGSRQAVLTPGSVCGYCPALPDCAPGRAWEASRDGAR
jgi:hypothetical protein